MNNNTYTCELHTGYGKAHDVEMQGYSAEFIYSPPKEGEMNDSQKVKYKLAKQICENQWHL
jgi:hypothetical protein